jgi:hypothetical protein
MAIDSIVRNEHHGLVQSISGKLTGFRTAVLSTAAVVFALAATACSPDNSAYKIPENVNTIDRPAQCQQIRNPAIYSISTDGKDPIVVETIWCYNDGYLSRYERIYSKNGDVVEGSPWKEVTRIE